MLEAFTAVQPNRGAAGIDKVRLQRFEAHLADNLRAWMRDLPTGSFEPHPLRRVFIPTNETEFRPLGIPALRDRVAPEGVRRLWNPLFEPVFHPASFGFRPNRNCPMALEAVLELHRAGYSFVLDADIKGFFANRSHPIILQNVAERVADGNMLPLVEKLLPSGVMDNGVFKPTPIGTPPGGLVSPRLATLVLNHLDWQLDRVGLRFVRYADDFVVLTPTPEPAKEPRARVEPVWDGGLGFQLSREKTKLTSLAKGYAVFGFTLSSRSRRMRPKSVKKFNDQIRELTPRKFHLDGDRIEQLNRVSRGTAPYFATDFFTARELLHTLDSWIRMRLRGMTTKRNSFPDNPQIRNKVFDRLGLLTLERLALCRQDRGFVLAPRLGQSLAGSPAA